MLTLDSSLGFAVKSTLCVKSHQSEHLKIKYLDAAMKEKQTKLFSVRYYQGPG